ncbi:serine hydrolase [Pseudaminobacter soli (ex Li et al. 2025)]|uniref:Serine hydrolase n=1 Tax=Pseudaminobacter soli (ex Li et al. 2025) TaxID=1295366 RepID=A0A2P7S1S2_9HYPH|nr:serine hydrolase [Mesorhizobium soli]PSJ56425.1 hypothetical protein C7I85_24380 [Mesorhizobium soli]
MAGTAPASKIHPAASALAEALEATRGALNEAQVSVAACLYGAPLRNTDPGTFIQQAWWGHRATSPVYPASVVKLFFLNALAAFREEGLIDHEQEDDRAAAEMIRTSSNEATVYLVGRLTGADDGPPLHGQALEDWCVARQRVQDWYLTQNREEFAGINVLHGTYQDSPYGRAYQARRNGNGNLLTALSAAALMHDIARGARPGSAWMMDLLSRDFQRGVPEVDPEGDQVRDFLVEGLPGDVRTWSKAGHTSWTRHDLVYGERPDGRAFTLCVMSEGKWPANDKTFLPDFARRFYRHAFDVGVE